ncbi:MAG: type I-E CRISPR-associated protein Cse2/CasB [bacterium]
MKEKSEKEVEKEYFIEYLEELLKSDNRGALSALRRGLSAPPGTVPYTYPYVIPYLPEDVPPDSKRAIPYFLVASLFALYFTGKGKEQISSKEVFNLGVAFRKAKGETSKEDSIDSRFTALLNSHYDDLPNHLRHAVSFLRSKEIPLNWNELLSHIKNWNHPDRWVQKKLARGFWGEISPDKNVKTESH